MCDMLYFRKFKTKKTYDLLPTGSEEKEVLGVGSIPVAILPSCQDMKTIALYFHKYEYSLVVIHITVT